MSANLITQRARIYFLFVWFCLFLCSSHCLIAAPEPPKPKRLEPVPDLSEEGEEEISELLEEPATKGSKNIAKDFKNFGEEVASRIDKVVSRKSFELWGDPWTIQGIPLIFPSPNNGFHLGLHAKITDIKRTDPHKLEIMAQALASDRGRYKHFLQVDYPYAFGGLYRITSRISYNRDISHRYYGIGNETVADEVSLANDTPFHHNIRSGPVFTLQLLRYMGHFIRTGPVLGLKWLDVIAPPGSLLRAENPVGTPGGRTHYVGWGIVRDTLDFEPYPSRGTLHELYFYWYSPHTGSSYDFLRSSYTFRYYIPLHRKLTFAHRTFVEWLSGNVPYYELSAAGGSDSTIGFGGDRFMRGFDGNRFIDHIRAALGFELRWDPLQFGFAKQDLSLGFVPFVDVGRVWSKVSEIKIGKLHASTGWGTRIIWGKRLIIRADYALTTEGSSFYVELGNSF